MNRCYSFLFIILYFIYLFLMIVITVTIYYGYFAGFEITMTDNVTILKLLFNWWGFNIFGSFFICYCYAIRFVIVMFAIFILGFETVIIIIMIFLVIIMRLISVIILIFVKFHYYIVYYYSIITIIFYSIPQYHALSLKCYKSDWS